MVNAPEPTSTTLLELDAIAADWNALAESTGAAPWLRADWVRSWWKAFGSGRLQVIAATRGARLVAVLPLRLSRGASSSPTNWHSPSFGVVADDETARRAVLDRVWAARPRSVSLHLLDSASGDVEAFSDSARRAGYAILTRVELRSPYVPTVTSLDAYVAELPQGRKLAKELRRQQRRLQREHGPVTLRLEAGATDFERLFADALALEGSGWKTQRGSDMAADPAVRGFYEEVARSAAQRQALCLAFLDVGDSPRAFDLLLRDRDRLYDLKGGYDEDFRPFGPGKLLLERLLAHASESGLQSLELLGTDEPYKLQWTSMVRTRVLVQAFAPSPAGRTERLAYRHGRPIAKAALARWTAFRDREG